jgi:hypothetical protein
MSGLQASQSSLRGSDGELLMVSSPFGEVLLKDLPFLPKIFLYE